MLPNCKAVVQVELHILKVEKLDVFMRPLRKSSHMYVYHKAVATVIPHAHFSRRTENCQYDLQLLSCYTCSYIMAYGNNISLNRFLDLLGDTLITSFTNTSLQLCVKPLKSSAGSTYIHSIDTCRLHSYKLMVNILLYNKSISLKGH